MIIILLVLLVTISTLYSKEYKAVEELDLNKYVGSWYEVYGNNFDKTFQGNGKCIQAFYKLNNYNVSVLNTQLDKNDNSDSITGFAYYKEGDTGGYLTVQLKDLPEAPYWIIELGPIYNDMYDYAIVSDNVKLSLFVLTRNVSRFYKEYDETVLNSLEDFGFNKLYNKPLEINQDC
tara:strand:+ start:156 stop:683 length:528 start_codon:yes stop_codon:yes gene_type:complete